MNTVDILLGAKEALLRDGWQQGSIYSMEGRRTCLIGACRRAYSGNVMNGEVDAPVASALLSATDATAVTLWNDEPGRTFNEVIDLIDSTLVRLKETPEV